MAPNRAATRVILTSGKIAFDAMQGRKARNAQHAAIVRLEQLYPFPSEVLARVLGAYPNAKEIRWLQEEPLNMGAWNTLRPHLRLLVEDRLTLHYVGRPESSSPSEGSSTLYRINQQSLIEQAFDFDRQAQTTSVVKERG